MYDSKKIAAEHATEVYVNYEQSPGIGEEVLEKLLADAWKAGREDAMPLDFNTLRKTNYSRLLAFGKDYLEWTATDWACEMAGECGEACNKVKKRRRGENVPLQEVADELADTVIAADLLAIRLGIDLGEAVRVKFNATSLKNGLPQRL